MSSKKVEIPPVNGHYSQAVSFNDLVFISGQLPIVDGILPTTFSEEVKCVLEKLDNILEASGCTKRDVIQVRVYLVGIERWDEVNEIYAKFFGGIKPARAIVPVPELHFGCSIEIEAIARKNSDEPIRFS